MRIFVALLAVALVAGTARAQPVSGNPALDAKAEAEPIGPVITIESIEIVGNTATQDDVILDGLPLHVGDALRAGDRRLREARFKLLALGFFRDVTLGLRKGSARGQVVLTVTVIERGTVVLNRLWFGNSVTSPWWLGADATERDFIGTGLAVGGGAIFADDNAAVAGSRKQWAGELRVANPSLLGTKFGIDGSFTWIHGSEPYRVDGTSSAAANFHAFSFQRTVVRGGLSWDATALSRLSGGLRFEAIHAALPVAPTRTLPSGDVVGLDLYLNPGASRVVSVDVAFDRDSRTDPVLPRSGTSFSAEAELGSSLLGGSYDFARLTARWERWWPVKRHSAIALRTAAGVVIGDAPRFERIHVGDVDRLLTPRALGLVVSAEGSDNILGTGTADVSYGDVGGSAIVEFSHRLFRGEHVVYGGDWFVGGGLWGLSTRDDLAVRDTTVWKSLPIDLIADAGVRLDTALGIFELTIANALGRLPL